MAVKTAHLVAFSEWATASHRWRPVPCTRSRSAGSGSSRSASAARTAARRTAGIHKALQVG